MGAFLRKYATATHVYIPIIKRAVVDFAVGADWTPATGDVKVSIDGATAGNIGTLPTAVAMGNTAYWDFTLATGETTGKKVIVTVADSATKAVEDQSFLIETYGHASAEYQADLSLANLPANVTQLLGTAWLTPGTAGTPDVNAKLWNGLTTVELPLVPTTAGRKLDVSVGGEAGIDWANVGSPTTTVGLTNTTIGVLTTYTGNTVQTGDSFARIGATGSGLTSLAPSSTALSTAQWTNTRAGYLDNIATAAPTAAAITTAVWTTTTVNDLNVANSPGQRVTDNLNATVSSRMATYTQPTGFLAATFPATVASTTNITAGTITTVTTLTNLPAITSNWLTAAGIATDAGAEIAAAVWDLATSGHTTSGTFGEAMNAAGSAGDPWTTSIPGAYGAGTAGFILGTNLDVASSTLATTTSLDALIATVGVAGLGLSAIPKTGFKLASDGLDSISTTAPSGVASNFREMLVQTWRRFFKKATQTSSQLKTYADDGTTVVTTQIVNDNGTTETQGAAS